jgi:hypothetical protein
MKLKEQANISSNTLFLRKTVMWGKKVVLRLTNCVPVQLTETVEDQKS